MHMLAHVQQAHACIYNTRSLSLSLSLSLTHMKEATDSMYVTLCLCMHTSHLARTHKTPEDSMLCMLPACVHMTHAHRHKGNGRVLSSMSRYAHASRIYKMMGKDSMFCSVSLCANETVWPYSYVHTLIFIRNSEISLIV
jgi:hypothetical protein